MKKVNLEELFENLKDEFEVHNTPFGHKERFLKKLEARKNPSQVYRSWWKPLSIAASVAIIFGIGFIFLQNGNPTADLGSVSPEMAQTQSFFTSEVNKEIEILKGYGSPETKILVSDVLKQLNVLETEYNGLKKDLADSGNDKRVVYAMINNFQKRIDLLKQVITKIEEVKTLKLRTNETNI
ncbi:hypothetical protein EI546_02040 [Aequorivita sp. H23M31]|uniref:DUF4179 domain-containing protein n=1 Tax=Aequorivita ciconiae TaxID=2494375 RepID=A0A410G012_9FLAO|nr:hypothetical protein [Aequorivita sp. H23M31]QAA80583.1 hypothetical protein EI546_02040 [Aequorivita sp. H23M31]